MKDLPVGSKEYDSGLTTGMSGMLIHAPGILLNKIALEPHQHVKNEMHTFPIKNGVMVLIHPSQGQTSENTLAARNFLCPKTLAVVNHQAG